MKNMYFLHLLTAVGGPEFVANALFSLAYVSYEY